MPLLRWPFSILTHKPVEKAGPIVVVSYANQANEAQGRENGGNRTAPVHRLQAQLGRSRRAAPTCQEPTLAEARKLEPRHYIQQEAQILRSLPESRGSQ